MKASENVKLGLAVKPLDRGKLAELGVRFAMGVALGRVRIFGSFAPFGPALVGAAPAGAAGIVTLAGACLGALTAGSLSWSLKYIAIDILIWTALHFFADAAPGYFPMALTFGLSLVIGFVYAWDSGFEIRATAMWVVESFAAGGFVFFYTAALSPWSNSQGRNVQAAHAAGEVLLLATLLMSVSVPQLFGVLSLGRCACVAAILFIAYRGGVGMGCVAAAVLGAAMDLAQGGMPFFTLSYVFSALIAGVFSRSGRLTFCLAWIGATALSVLWFWAWRRWLPALYETFAATVIFTLLPDHLLARAAVFLPTEPRGFGFMKAREYALDRVEQCADAFSALYDAVHVRAGDGVSDDLSEVFDRASDAVCRSCPHSARCWQEKYGDTVDVMNHLSPVLLSGGGAGIGDLPEWFLKSCDRADKLIGAVNTETRSFLTRRQYRARLDENRLTAFRQYSDVSAVLRSLARELGSEITVEPGLERKLQKYLRGLAIDGSVAVFRVRGGRLRAELRSAHLHTLKRDDKWLDKLSAVLGTRLCTSENGADPDRLILLEAEPYAIRVGAAWAKKAGETVSGDKYVSFRTDEGFLYVLLSDGMGSGQAAAKTSAEASGIIESFLRAGIRPELALRILSDLMLLKSDSSLESATVDLLALDMFSGQAVLYKYGASPSYLHRGPGVRRIAGSALPVGLDNTRRAGTKLTMSPGSLLVMATDGVTAGGEDKWLRRTIGESSPGDVKTLAKTILDEASKRTGCEDDITVIAVLCEERA